MFKTFLAFIAGFVKGRKSKETKVDGTRTSPRYTGPRI